MSAKEALPVAANDARSTELSPLSHELVIGLVGYAGAGCSTAARRLQVFLNDLDYEVRTIKLSELIAGQRIDVPLPDVSPGKDEGRRKLERAKALQDLGDTLRKDHGSNAVASLAIRAIRSLRSGSEVGKTKIAFILDSLKHHEEVELLRRVYDSSFRLIAVHCERDKRERRLIGSSTSTAKYRGVRDAEVQAFMDRDEKDSNVDFGQEVRDAFYIADYFLDNSSESMAGENLSSDIQRFVELVLGEGLVRPTKAERAMYHAQAAALQSSCLSRQVGAALATPDGEILATGTNDVPRFGGGVYQEGDSPDHRCHVWKFEDGEFSFIGCHNDRRKKSLRADIGRWLAENMASELAAAVHPKKAGELDAANQARAAAERAIRGYLESASMPFEKIPGVKDIIEYSRAIHAEMEAVLNASRSGVSPAGNLLYCTTYPCHNCARHLVAAGIKKVYFIEPYVKSLATELHSDAITADPRDNGPDKKPWKMAILPFTGVGPRMYDDLFVKRSALKGGGGVYVPPKAGTPAFAVRLKELARVEEAAAMLVPEVVDG